MTDTSLVIAPENDPNRCKTITAKGQCVNMSLPNGDQCAMHNRTLTGQIPRQRITDLYQNQFRERMKEFSGPGYKSLAAEVGILRVGLDSILKNCEHEGDLILNMGPVSHLVGKIGDIVSQIDKIDMNSGNMLDVDDISSLSMDIINIISRYVTDPSTLKSITEDIATCIKARVSEPLTLEV